MRSEKKGVVPLKKTNKNRKILPEFNGLNKLCFASSVWESVFEVFNLYLYNVLTQKYTFEWLTSLSGYQT